ncbi:MAG TPA: hypothetical protein VGI06_10555 [Acidimicrobiales bacterium]
MPSNRLRLAAALSALVVAGCAPSVRGHSLIGDPTPIANVPTLPSTAPPAPSTTEARPTTAARPTTTLPSPSTTALDGQPSRPYPVGFTLLNLTDPTRTTGTTPGRHLPTLVFYPAVGPGHGAETGSAPGLFHSWPLVVFAEGYAVTPLTYHDLIHSLAASGFVVAAPAFPLETKGGNLNEGDLRNEPDDIKYVVSQALAASAAPGLLHGMIDPTHVGLIGHSDGGEAALGAAYLPGVADARVGPVIAMSASGSLTADRFPPTPRHDLMVVQGTADTVNPPADGDRLYATAPSPKAYLQLLGAGHLPPFTTADQWEPVVEAVIVDWFDAWFSGPYSGSAAGRLGRDGNVNGVAQVQLG